MKKLIFLILTISLSLFAPLTVQAVESYNFYIVDSFETGDVNSCAIIDETCYLNSAVKLAEDSPLNSVILLDLPYKQLYESEASQTIPFYLVKESSLTENSWRLFPAPLIGKDNLENLDQDITDYFLTWNVGIMRNDENSTFLNTLFFGQFRKFNTENTKPGDYDLKLPFFRTLDIPQNLRFTKSEEVLNFLNGIKSGEVNFDRITLNGFHLRIYERSFSEAVFAIIFVVTILIVLLNFLVFPNILVYISLLLGGVNKAKVIGLIYDSQKKSPVRLAVIRIYSIQNGVKKFIKQTVSDLDGKYYGFNVNKGEYVIEVKHSDYQTKESTHQVYEDNSVIAYDLGLSVSNTKTEGGFVSNLRSYSFRKVQDLNKTLVFFNLFIAIINLLLAQNIFNIFIFGLALLQFITYRFFFSKRKDMGEVINSQTGDPIQGAFIKIFDQTGATQLNSQLTDENGRFGFVANQSDYLIKIESVGYSFPSLKDTNQKFTSTSNGTFIKLKVSKDKNFRITILLDPS